MSTYVLVHGSGHGSWCWGLLTPLLQGYGHQTIAVDLPGNGHDDTPKGEVTLDTYAQWVCQVLDEQSCPVILVGHSLGGLSISQAAEYRPDKISVLVYFAGLLFRPGETFVQLTSDGAAAKRQALEERPYWDISDDLSYVVHKPDIAVNRFYNGCSPEQVAWAISMLKPQPVGPLVSPVSTTEENFGRVPRVYVECLNDQAILPARQKEMYTNVPCQQIISMNTGHSPFLVAPEESARVLHELARFSP